MENISFSDFSKLDLRVGRIIEVEKHPSVDKLFVLQVEFGEDIGQKQIVAGLKNYYSADELIDKFAVFVVNFETRNLRGVESHGMILAAVSDDKGDVVFLTPEKDIAEGTRIS